MATSTPDLSGIFDYLGRTTYDAGSLVSDNPIIQKMIDEQILTKTSFKPAMTGQNEGGEFNIPEEYGYSFDSSRLPPNVFGLPVFDLKKVEPDNTIAGGFKLRNQALIRDDPIYGKITPSFNLIDPSRQTNFYDLIGPIVMSLVFAGAGGGLFGAASGAQKTVFRGSQIVQNLAKYFGGKGG